MIRKRLLAFIIDIVIMGLFSLAVGFSSTSWPAGKTTRISKGVRHGMVSGAGNADDIFKAITKGDVLTKNGAIEMPNGQIIHLHTAKSNGMQTITINQKGSNGVHYKIRIQE